MSDTLPRLEPSTVPQPPQRLNTDLATAALILGIFGIVIPLCAVAAIVLGIMQLSRIKRQPGAYGGRRMARAGIRCGASGLTVFLTITGFLLVVMVSAQTQARNLTERLACSMKMRAIGTSMQEYAFDNFGEFPPDLATLVDRKKELAEHLSCPGSRASSRGRGADYIYIPGQDQNCDPQNVLLYEAAENHEKDGGNVLFIRGDATFVEPYSEVERLVRETKERLQK